MGRVNLRTLGVTGQNLPAKKTLTVIPSDFLIGGMLIECERMYNKAFKVSNMEEFAAIFGANINALQYGNDAVKGFFDNTVGVDSSLYIQALPGYNVGGTAIDAVVASRNKADVGADADAYTVKAAYEDELQYGASGNRIGTKFTQATRFSTTATAQTLAAGTSATLASIIGMRVGDIVKFVATGGGGATVYKKITAIDESAKTISWTGAFHGSVTLESTDVVSIPGFTVQTYYKSVNGIETEVDLELGKIICSSEPEVVDFYVENIFKSSKYIQINEGSGSTLGDRLPSNDSVITYPTNGADGTAVASVAAQAYFLNNFDGLPIRFLANPEVTDADMQKDLVRYSMARYDNPLVIINIASDRTKSQLEVIGNSFQRSDRYPGHIVANWLKVSDPFTSSSIAPYRSVPNVGHVMGAWIWTIGTLGIHFIPATDQTILKGIAGVVGDQFTDENDRTDLAECGINVIQEKSGTGIKIANLYTLSTDEAYMFGNILLMANYIKVSCVDSLAGSENTPNSLNRIQSDKMRVLSFMHDLWNKGSTGGVTVGETFGQSQNTNGTNTKAEDHFQVIADITNNPQSKINLGERNIDIYFTAPPPAGSIVVGVGVLLRG